MAILLTAAPRRKSKYRNTPLDATAGQQPCDHPETGTKLHQVSLDAVKAILDEMTPIVNPDAFFADVVVVACRIAGKMRMTID